MQAIVKSLLYLALTVLQTCIAGWVISHIWNWYVGPAMDMADITPLIGIGIQCLFTCLKGPDNLLYLLRTQSEPVQYEKLMAGLIGIFYDLSILFTAWLFHFAL